MLIKLGYPSKDASTSTSTSTRWNEIESSEREGEHERECEDKRDRPQTVPSSFSFVDRSDHVALVSCEFREQEEVREREVRAYPSRDCERFR
jgi:hypothetical protein